MPRYYCLYCKTGLVSDEQRDAHEDCGHTVKRLEFLPPGEDHRLETYREFGEVNA